MKIARRLPTNPTLEEQVKLLTREVLVNNDKFQKGTAGIIVSLKQHDMYWVLLNHAYKTKEGHWSRKRLFKPSDIKLIDEK